MMKFGLTGHPIGHSLSPALFRAGYDGRYPYELIETADFEEAYGRFLEEYDGINVTAPFKELAYAKADILSEECRMIGATNLLVKTPEGIKAYNSDYLGVRMWLCEVADTTPVKALIVGLGGAGKAAAVAAASLGMSCILMNRDMSKAEAMADKLGAMKVKADVRPLSGFRNAFKEADIIIYNIPAAIPDLNILADSDFNPGNPKFILEANYKDPSFGKDLIARMKAGNPLAQYTEGRTWLLYQALTGYEIFTGEKPDLKKMSDVL